MRGLPEAEAGHIVAGMVHPTTERLALLTGEADPALRERDTARYQEAALRLAGLATLYPGMDGMLRHLAASGLRLAVLSNSEGAFIRLILGRLGVAPLFAALVGEDDMPAPKPDPGGLHLALDGIHPGEAVLVGDSSTDLATARAGGTRAIGVTWGTHVRRELEPLGFDALVDDPRELQALA